jgi:hypothetical protein
MSHIVLPDRQTAGSTMLSRIKQIYAGEHVPLLPAPR